MTKLEKILTKKIKEKKNIVIIFDVKNENGFLNEKLIRKNLSKMINTKNYPVLRIDIISYKNDIDILFKGSVNKFPYVIKYENMEITEVFDNFLDI